MSFDPNRVKSIFLEAGERADPADRAAYLAGACGNDADLRGRVDALLRAEAEDNPPTADGIPGTQTGTGSASPIAGEGAGLAGTVIAGKYKLVEPIGEGGMGSVWMARQTEPVRRLVAVKLIKPGMDSKAVLARFDAERQALAVMGHPNIATVLDAGTHSDGRPYFVMELVRGMPITKFCDERKLTPRQRLELFVPVCEAVQHAHQKGVIHRDIKPANVLVAMYDDRAVPKVIDFGVAHATGAALTEQTLETGFGQVVGTPAYMAPEQAGLNNLDVDTRADVYGLGALLYELLAGTPPFAGAELRRAGILEMLRMVREDEPPRPSTRLSTAEGLPSLAAERGTEPGRLTGLLRSELDWLVMKALEKDRTRRYESAAGFAADVRRYLAGEAVLAAPPGRRYLLRKFARRNRRGLAAAAVLGMALAAGAAGTLAGFVRAERVKVEAAERDTAAAEREAAAARDAASKSGALAGVLQKLLGTADPDIVGGADYTLRQLLDDRERELSEELRDQPEVEADLRLTIGTAYNNLDLSSKTEAQFRRALALRRGAFGPDHPKVAEALTALAWCLRGYPADDGLDLAVQAAAIGRRNAESLEAARAAVRILDRAGIRDGESFVRAQTELASIATKSQLLQNRQPDGEAVEAARAAVRAASPAPGERPSKLACKAAEALIFSQLDPAHLAESTRDFGRVVEMCRAAYPAKHPALARALSEYGNLCGFAGRLEDADEALKEAVTRYILAYGNVRHSETFEASSRRSDILELQFRTREAAGNFAEEEKWRPPVATPLPYSVRRGFTCLDRGDPAEGEAEARHFVAWAEAHPAAEFDGQRVKARFLLGVSLYDQGRFAEARVALGEGAMQRSRDAAAGTYDIAHDERLYRWAPIVAAGRPADLDVAIRLSERRLAEEANPRTPIAAECRVIVAIAHHRKGDHRYVVDELPEVLPRLAFMYGPNVIRHAEDVLAGSQAALEDWAGVENTRRAGLARARIDYAPGHPEIADRQMKLADFLIVRHRHAEAELELLPAYHLLESHPQADDRSLVRRRGAAADLLIRLYRDWGNPVEEAKWQSKRSTQPELLPAPRTVPQ